MAFQTVFKRYELKYLITRAQQQRLLYEIQPYVRPDSYGKTTVRNVYFDTDSYRLIRRSIEKPVYKEKLRIRSYAQASDGSTVFVELKKKYESVVYKRRLALPLGDARAWLTQRHPPTPQTQISHEIDYFLDYYTGLQPKVLLTYEREAYYAIRESDVRITFDDQVMARTSNVSLSAPPGGNSLLPDDRVLMEIKTAGGIPLWLTALLTREHIYKTPFSKYGKAYEAFIYPHTIHKTEDDLHA